MSPLGVRGVRPPFPTLLAERCAGRTAAGRPDRIPRAPGSASPRRRLGSAVLPLLAASVLALGIPPPAAAADESVRLVEALRELRKAGAPLAWSSRTVPGHLRGPRAGACPGCPLDRLREVAAELLEPFALALVDAGDRWIVVSAPAAPSDGVAPRLEVTAAEAIEVVGTRTDEPRLDPVAAVSRSPGAVELGIGTEEPMRAAAGLPGLGMQPGSARPRVDGGRPDEVLILLDGQELVDPFHLRDFGGTTIHLPAESLEEVQVSRRGYPVRFGDRHGAVLELATRRPDRPRRHALVLRSHELVASTGGRTREGGAEWFVSARSGDEKPPTDLGQSGEDAAFHDGFAKLDLALGPRWAAGFRVLGAEDEYRFLRTLVFADGEPPPVVLEQFEVGSEDRTAWLTLEGAPGSAIRLGSRLGASRRDHRRQGLEDDVEPVGYRVADRRSVDRVDLEQTWTLAGNRGPGTRTLLGYGLRTIAASYDYSNRLAGSPFCPDASCPTGAGQLELELEDAARFAFLSRRRAVGAATLELGIRYDESASAVSSPGAGGELSTGEQAGWSPRAAAVVDLSSFVPSPPDLRLRLAWGRYLQSQRADELQVADGQTAAEPWERAEHRLVGLEGTFGSAGPVAGSWRFELSEQRVGAPRGRWENRFRPLARFPELEPDRIRLQPDASRTRGLLAAVELRRSRWDLGASWELLEVRDRFGDRTALRKSGQPHRARLDLAWRPGPRWRGQLSFAVRSGAPVELFEPAPDSSGAYRPTGERLRTDDLLELDLLGSRSLSLFGLDVDVVAGVRDLLDRRAVLGWDALVRPDGGLEPGAPERTRGRRWFGSLRIAY